MHVRASVSSGGFFSWGVRNRNKHVPGGECFVRFFGKRWGRLPTLLASFSLTQHRPNGLHTVSVGPTVLALRIGICLRYSVGIGMNFANHL